MLHAGKSQKEADEWETLVREITQVIAAKQLVPTVRTQCMRTAFQIPFDASVRISLDTNLCMISERGYDLQNMRVWHRDKSWVLEDNEIHRFPHAILEIKLEMGGDKMAPPKWVTDLQNSGMLYECHKFSKYIHGCMVLLPENIRAAPYWVDDVTIRQAIIDSGAECILVEENVGTGPGATSIYKQLLPFGSTIDNRMETAVGRTASDLATSRGLAGEKGALLADSEYGIHFYSCDEDDDALEEGDESGICGWLFPFCSNNNTTYELLAPTRFQKIEPKIFFANERVFLHWLHYGVILSTIASGILAFSRETGETWAAWYALILLPLSLLFCIYALHVFLWRADRIKSRIPSRWDDPRGPIIIGSIFALVLVCNFVVKVHFIVRNRNGP
uniref:Uncharacterized protein n=2 Tax=Amphora coffeiformis TaxID=265554 RepID=A0A7S3L3G9_9STRA